MPSTGALVDSLMLSLDDANGNQRKERPEIVGLPHPYLAEYIRDKFRTEFENIVFLGKSERD